jgi:hypothetical protein
VTERLLGLFDELAFITAVVASATLAGLAGWTIPTPYFHQSVDWILYGTLGTVGVVVLALRTPGSLPTVVGLLAAFGVVVAGLLLDWSAWHTSVTAEVSLIGGMCAGMAPVRGALSLGIGAVFGLLDLSVELILDRVDTFVEGLGFVIGDIATVAGIVAFLIVMGPAAAAWLHR